MHGIKYRIYSQKPYVTAISEDVPGLLEVQAALVPVHEGDPGHGVLEAGHRPEAVHGQPRERRHREARGGLEDQPPAGVQHLGGAMAARPWWW